MTGRAASLRRRLEPPPRAVDWAILVCTLFEAGSGLLSLGAGDPAAGLLFVAHGVVGPTLLALVGVKLARVRRRLLAGAVPLGERLVAAVLALVTLAALGTGVAWVAGATVPLGFWTLLNVHVGLGLLVVPLLAVHLLWRFHAPTRRDVAGRRRALQYAGLFVFGAAAYRATEAAGSLAGVRRRFTGSRPLPPGEGNGAFPVTSWVADDPDPVDRDAWRLSVTGLVKTPLELGVDDVAPDETRAALLDCTSGWYTEQEWAGVRLGALLSAAGPDESARWVTVRSVTGFRWSFPLAEARGLLLATHVGGDPLSHGHGAPVRLVAPNRRGFQWVKWVTAVEVRRHRDPAQWVAVLVSGFD